MGYDYYYLGDQLIEEAPIYADGTVAFEYSTHWLYAPNQLTPTARYQQGQLNYVITDPLGTPTELLAEDGIGRWSVKHHLWGSILKQYSANDEDFCNLRSLVNMLTAKADYITIVIVTTIRTPRNT